MHIRLFCAVSLINFCGGDDSVPITVKCYDWDGASKDDLIGECSFTMRDVFAHIANPALDTLSMHVSNIARARAPRSVDAPNLQLRLPWERGFTNSVN